MLVLVVGPSGAGKDTLLQCAQKSLAGDRRFRFARRVITRPPGNDAEQHEPAEPGAFEARRETGGFAISWQAHGLHYGIPSDIGVDIAAGRVVVASVSRTSIGEARNRFRVRVIEITASSDVLAKRLAQRGREHAAAIAGRLSRSIALPAGLPKETIVNDGTIELSARTLLGALIRAAEAVRSG